MPLSTLESKWVPTNCKGNLANAEGMGVGNLQWNSILSTGVEIQSPSHFRNLDKLQTHLLGFKTLNDLLFRLAM